MMLKKLTICLLCTLLLTSCKEDIKRFSMADFAKVEKIDAHVHLNFTEPALVQQAQQDNFKLLTINVDYPDFPPIAKQRQVARQLIKTFPRTVAYATTFSTINFNAPDFAKLTIADLAQEFRQGAVGVKVWKNIGMSLRNKQGGLVMIDDKKFDAIFNYIKERKKVLIGHQSEPKDAWLPIKDMVVEGDKTYFAAHPQYYMYLRPEMPSYEDQIAARDRMLDKNKELLFVGAHLASLEWSIDELAAFLDKYPNAVVDLAARMGHLQAQTQKHWHKVRQFFIKYQDRILYGTDLMTFEKTDSKKLKEYAHKLWRADWQYVNTAATMTSPEIDGKFRGLALPRQVVRKIYWANAQKRFPDAWRNQILKAKKIKKDFIPNGKMTHPQWRRAQVVKIEYTILQKTYKPKLVTMVKALWSDKYLYLGYCAPYTKLQVFKNSLPGNKERIGLWENDVVEAFIQNNSQDVAQYEEFQVAPNGEFLDVILNNGKRDFSWSSGFTAVAKINPKRKVWTAVMRIPLQSLDTELPELGEMWRINLFRVDKSNKALMAWRQTDAETFHVPERFGALVFASESGRLDSKIK